MNKEYPLRSLLIGAYPLHEPVAVRMRAHAAHIFYGRLHMYRLTQYLDFLFAILKEPSKGPLRLITGKDHGAGGLP